MVTTAVDKWPAYARLSAVAQAGHLPTAPTPSDGTRPKLVMSGTSPIFLDGHRRAGSTVTRAYTELH
jgi:hypothetical protein